MQATDSTTELAAAVRRREVGSVELLDLYLDRIDHLGGDINAVVTLDVDRARAACTAADEAVARGGDVGPLHGLPITVKDAIETAGIRSTGGAVEFLTDHVPADDAPVVARVKAAGAIVFGKTNLPRWSGDLQSYNEIFGTTNNPWDTSRVPGGKPRPAAAVACGFTSFEIGTDIGGSIRIPSHFCGTFGLKPSFGVVSQRGYLDRIGGGTTDADINVFGPMARSAEDLDLLLDVMAGPDADRSAAWRLELPRSTVDSLAGARVALWFDEPAYPIDAEYRAVLGHTADALANAGARVETAHPPVNMVEQVALFRAMIGPALSPSMPADVAQAVSGSHLDWLRLEQHAAVSARWVEWFADWDVLLCPVTPTPAFRHDQESNVVKRTLDVNGEKRSYFDNIAWTGLIGIVGLPSAVPPLGTTASGLPVGVQVVAPYLHDRTAVHVAGLIAETVDGAGYRAPPGF